MTSPLAAFSDALASLVERAAPGIVAVHGRARMGSSGIVLRDGVIVTADEALDRDEDLRVTLADGQEIAATLAGRDPSTDVAVLRVEGVVAPSLARAEDVRPGQLALALGLHAEGPVASLGLVAVAGEPWRSMRGGRIDRRIHFDSALDPRAEGGALLDAEGRLIGMSVFGPRRRVLAIPATTIDRVVELLLARGRIPRGYLGAALQPIRLDERVRREAGLDQDRAAILVGIDADGPAARAGLLLGDVLATWNGEPVRGARDVFAHLAPESVGETVELRLVRAGALLTASVTVGERSAP